MEKTTAAAEPSEPSQQRGSGCGGWQVQCTLFIGEGSKALFPWTPAAILLKKQINRRCGRSWARAAGKRPWPRKSSGQVSRGQGCPSPDEVHEAAGPPAQCKDRTRVHTRRPLSTPRRPPLHSQLGKGRARVQPLPHAAGKELALSKSPDLRIPCPPTMLRMMPLLPGPLAPVAMWSSAKDQ